MKADRKQVTDQEVTEIGRAAAWAETRRRVQAGQGDDATLADALKEFAVSEETAREFLDRYVAGEFRNSLGTVVSSNC